MCIFQKAENQVSLLGFELLNMWSITFAVSATMLLEAACDLLRSASLILSLDLQRALGMRTYFAASIFGTDRWRLVLMWKWDKYCNEYAQRGQTAAQTLLALGYEFGHPTKDATELIHQIEVFLGTWQKRNSINWPSILLRPPEQGWNLAYAYDFLHENNDLRARRYWPEVHGLC